MHGESSMESDFELETLQLRSRDLTIWPPRNSEFEEKHDYDDREQVLFGVLCHQVHQWTVRLLDRSSCEGPVIKSRLWDWRVPGSKPDSTEDPPCMGPVAR
ncbi:hypothetical protein AVEN_12699-1 [Araneus ventricosus]|uniref:Uncharacterized protein n=1 Tax=Araneus ventricosus TaxID=182803 RepID=A0A4Y2ACK8_ARAVE|nr:hypothetical protein AVEN_12699-1 [Araneus ventricosus]